MEETIKLLDKTLEQHYVRYLIISLGTKATDT